MSTIQLIRGFRENHLRFFTLKGATALTRTSPGATAQILRRLAKEGIVVRLKRGVWANLLAPRLRLEEAIPFMTAPWTSYVSLYSALSEHGLIAEVPAKIYAVTGGRPMQISTPLGALSIHHLPPQTIWGFENHSTAEGFFPLAVPEKAWLDTLYLASVPRSPIRIPPFRHRPKFDEKKLKSFSRRWPFKAVP